MNRTSFVPDHEFLRLWGSSAIALANRNSPANRHPATLFRLATAPAGACYANLGGLPSSSWCYPSRSRGGSCDQPSMSWLSRWSRWWTERRKQIDLISAQNFIFYLISRLTWSDNGWWQAAKAIKPASKMSNFIFLSVYGNKEALSARIFMHFYCWWRSRM